MTNILNSLTGAGKCIVAGLVVLLMASAIMGGDCLLGVDVTASVLEADRTTATDFVVESLAELTSRYGCSTIVTTRFGNDGRWTMPRRTFAVPSRPQPEDCSNAEPDFSEGPVFIVVLDNFRQAQIRQHRKACRAREVALQQTFGDQWTALVDGVRRELAVGEPQRRVVTNIVDFLEGVVDGPRQYRVILVISDGLDRAVRRQAFTVPEDLDVVMILTRADPKYASSASVLDNAAAWEGLGVTVVLVSDIFPQLWQALSQSREAP